MKILNRFTNNVIIEIETTVNADLRWADLRGADLRGADLDFSCIPLWCGSFGMKVDTRFVWQIIAHLGRLDTTYVSKKANKALKAINPYVNEFCRYRDDVIKT